MTAEYRECPKCGYVQEEIDGILCGNCITGRTVPIYPCSYCKQYYPKSEMTQHQAWRWKGYEPVSAIHKKI